MTGDASPERSAPPAEGASVQPPDGGEVQASDSAEVRRAWRWKRTLVRIRRIVKGSVGGLALLTLILVGLASQTGRGQDMVLRAALDRVRSGLAGELVVDGVRSGTLLAGATLTGVRLDASDGRPFLSADSVVIRYSLLAAIFGGPPIRSTTVWGADIEISQYAPEQPLNLTLLLASGPDDSAERSTPRPQGLGHIGIRRGRARVLTPATASTGERSVMGPLGEPLRELAFDDLDLDVEDVVLTAGAPVAFAARLASFGAGISLLDRPLVVREIFGSLTFGDLGLRISDAAFRLPGSLLAGSLDFGPERPGEPWTFRSDLVVDGWADLADLQWIDPRIPDGRFRGGSRLAVRDGIDVDLDDLEVELEASHLVFSGGVAFREEMSLRRLSIAANPVTLQRLEPWLALEIPLQGWLSGRSTFTGTLRDFTAEGRVTLVPTGYGGRPSTADFSGTVHRGVGAGASDFRARIDPVNYTVLSAFWPQVPWAGTGSGTVRLDGTFDDGFEVEADLAHESAAATASGFGVKGMVWRGAEVGDWIADLDVELRPLFLDLLAGFAPDLGLQGSVRGPVEIEGSISDLHFDAQLESSGGRVGVDGRIDARTPSTGYRLGIVADSLAPAGLSTRFPPRTLLSGEMFVEGSGASLDSADVTARLAVRDSRVGGTRVDTIFGVVRMQDGVLHADSLRANVAGIGLTAQGRFGLVEGTYGAVRLDFEAPSVVGLRPLLMGVGDSVLVSDGLTELDREFLRLQGVEPDTLPSAREVRLEGGVSGSASLSGYLGNFDLGLLADVTGGRYRENQVDSARVALTAAGLPARDGLWQVGANAAGIVWDGRTFEKGGVEAEMVEWDGSGRIEVLRRAGEQYRAVGSFAVDSTAGRVDLAQGSIQVGSDVWTLTRPGRVTWNATTITVDSLEIARADVDPTHVLVDGVLTRGGESDFRVFIDGLHAEQVLHVAQLDDLEIEGHVEADLTVRGTSLAPRIDGTFAVLGPRYGALELTQVTGSFRYANRLGNVDVEGHDGVRPVLSASGTFPIDLSLTEVENRVLEEPMDLVLTADSLDAAIALSYLTTLDGVVGSVSGEVRVRGTPSRPEPDGVVRLVDAAWTVEEIGVRHSGVGGELRLRPDRTVEVSLVTRVTGFSEVTGTVLLEPVRDPTLDLHFAFQRFVAVSRPDVEGVVSGAIELAGTYRRPVATGSLVVDEGTIYVDELQRAAGVLDLSDPFLFDVGLAVDTTALVSQPLFAGLRNPFFDNLRVDVDLSVPRGSWLRSIDTNVEMTGDLRMLYDRFAGDFVLIGELEAVRGSHRVLGRNFELDGGRIAFIGRPGLNPDLDIQASTRIRSPDNPPIDVNAQVGGTLVRPVVTLSTDQTGLAEEDLISYVVFGQSSAQLSGRGQALGQSSFMRGGVTYVGGALANQLGSAIARELTLDYLSFQQSGSTQSVAAFGADAQLEVGRYVGEDFFVVMVLRPFKASPQDQNFVPGVRVEWALTDDYNVESFWEDRFLRSGSSTLATSAGLIDNDRIWGVFLFREWGYGSGRDP